MQGGWLTGTEIERQVRSGKIYIDQFDPSRLNPNSYNYSLGSTVRRLLSPELDLKSFDDDYEDLHLKEDGLVLYPSECYLGTTNEIFGSDWFASLVTGRSSVGRRFVTNHVTAGLIDVGFHGNITLEITVQRPTRVYAGLPFGQIFWFSVVGDIELYDGKYQGQCGPTPARDELEDKE